MKAIAFSNYLIYNIGGAEPSLILLLEERFPNWDKEVLSFEKTALYKANPLVLDIPKHLNIKFVPKKYGFSFFPFFEYFLNRKSLAAFFAKKETDSILASSIYASIAVNNSPVKNKWIFIQSDVDLGKAGNYETGIKWAIKTIYNLFQMPFVHVFKKDLKKAFNTSKIICNSNYTKKILQEEYGAYDCIVQHPIIDQKKLLQSYELKKNEITKKGIVFVGDSAHKGLHIAVQISQKMKNHTFYFFSKKVKEQKIIHNITYFPWVNNPTDAYKYAKLVIMPSQWNETFGRVGREAYLLNIPVIVSNCGGLPEAVYHDKSCLVDNFKDVNSWVKKINEMGL